MMLDYQFTNLGRPGNDITYFIYTSTSRQQRLDHLDELLHDYYNTFVQDWKSLGGDSLEVPFTFEEIVKEFDECFSFGLIKGVGFSQVSIIFLLLFFRMNCLNMN